MKCKRCRWDFARPVLESPSVPEELFEQIGLKDLPTFPEFRPHPEDSCPCPLAYGDTVFWNLGGADPDLPPIKGGFLALKGFCGPDYQLVDGAWKLVFEPIPSRAVICIDMHSVLKEHVDIFGDDLLGTRECYEVEIGDLVLAEKWPVLT